jgi:hypothetical protein
MALVGFDYRQDFVVNSAFVPSDQLDLVIYEDFSLAGAAFHSHVAADGRDIRYTEEDDTPLPREIVSIDTSGQTGEAHFRGDVSSASDTTFIRYYGNSSATEPAADSAYGSEAVWSPDYRGAWHLEESPADDVAGHFDSTSNDNTGTPKNFESGTGSTSATGQLGKCDLFDGVDDYVNVPDPGDGNLDFEDAEDFTIRVWAKSTTTNTQQQGIVAKREVSGGFSGWSLEVDDSDDAGGNVNGVRFTVDGTGGSVSSLASNAVGGDSTWHYIVAVAHRAGVSGIYVDGALGTGANNSQNISGITAIQNSIPLEIGRFFVSGADTYFEGPIDEVRVSQSRASENRINTEWNNQSDPGTFYTLGAEEYLGEVEAFLPTLTKAPAEPLGTWRIDNIAAGLSTVFGLKELRSGVNSKLPNNVFSDTDYPDADSSIYGSVIPVYIGAVRGMKAFKIDTTTDTFKFAGNATASVQSIVDEDGNSISVTSSDLPNSEFVWTGHTDETLYVSATAANPNPVDAMKFVYTDTDYGASIPLAKLDTTSTGKGYGTTGARVDFIYGTDADGTGEHNTINIGLYIDTSTKLADIIKLIKNAGMLTAYTDTTGLFQVKPFSPLQSEGLLEITEEHVIQGSRVVPQINTQDAVTKCRVFYNKDHRTGAEQVYEFESDELRQRRGLVAHAVRDLHLPISDLRGATIRAQREVVFEGEPRWLLSLKVTQEFSQLEPGDYVKLNYQETNGLAIRTVCEVVSKTYAGGIVVDLTLRDMRGLRRRVGWYSAASPAFPASLGGASITTWDSTWTDEEKIWVLENESFYHDPDGYCETLSATDDAFWAHYATVYI